MALTFALASLTAAEALAKGRAKKSSSSSKSTSSSTSSSKDIELVPAVTSAPAETASPTATTTTPATPPAAVAANDPLGISPPPGASTTPPSPSTPPATTGPTAAPAPATTVAPAVDDEPPEGAAQNAKSEPLSFVEHLGAEAYPGDNRGLYGGSLWLEPSFHGLQWPYMTHTGIGISGSAWIDNGYQTIDRNRIDYADTKQYVQQGRAVLRATPTYASGTFFVQGQMELVGNKDQVRSQSNANSGIVDVDDLWLRVGRWNSWDLKVGRFEGWEVYHTGMGLDINTIERRGAIQGSFGGNFERPDYYGVTYLHDRPSDQGVGNIALHVFPARILRVELLGQIGANVVSDMGSNSIGGRGVAILDLGFLKAKLGGEWVESKPAQTMLASVPDGMGGTMQVKQDSKQSRTQHGFGAALQLVLQPKLELGANFGVGLVDETDVNGNPIPQSATTTYSIGGFANVAVGAYLSPALRDLMVGVGVNWTTQRDLHRDPADGKVDYTANLQEFLAIQYIVSKQLFVKLVAAYARSDFDLGFDAGQWSNYMYSGRVRLMYLF